MVKNIIDQQWMIDVDHMPNWPAPTVEGHSGKLHFGYVGGTAVLLMSGRVHYYEGRSMDEVTHYVRVLSHLGVENLILTCATGSTGKTPWVKTGTICVIGDHINLMGTSPLIGPNLDEHGPRFVDMSVPYDPTMIRHGLDEIYNIFRDFQAQENAQGRYPTFHNHNAVTLMALSGPTFETPAEYRMGAILGADVVGMSTVPEVIVAKHCGIKVFAATIVTDNPNEPVSHEEVQAVATERAPQLARVIQTVIRRS